MKVFRLFCAIALTAVTSVAAADDGAITNKDMSRTINLPDFGQDIVNAAVPEDEHAFTDMMGFYVPAQAASGLVEPIAYCDIDNTPEPGEDCVNAVEELVVAKPLVNVFIHGPKFAVPDTAFGHSFMDTYVALSLDDGETWKQTNLSESADLSSFNLDTDHDDSGQGSGETVPGDHNQVLGGVSHAKGYETPFTSHCTECHGQGLQGVAEIPSCYSCHDAANPPWSEETPPEVGPVIIAAEDNAGTLTIAGVNAEGGAEVSILNAITGESVGLVTADGDGNFTLVDADLELPPCVVIAEYTDSTNDTLTGPSLSVKDETGELVEECVGTPVDLTEYPGGTYNVFHATAGNKTLVAWPSRFCEQGQPAYQMTAPTQPDLERLQAVTEFIRAGSTELGVDPLPDFTSTFDGEAVDDLYLVDAFGVAGNQGSIDFADEGYPQAGVVPFGCVWTARGVLLPGDDVRTTDITEASHMVWTKAERLTSGRRDVNRIEVKAVKGAGFVMTWQEDPEGLRPGQGLGPGEGWSGAVAHSQTDGWYSFINEEYFDIVETVDNTTVPIDILNHNLDTATGGSGRPQVYVPMAVPMRFSNNAKCNPPDTVTAGGAADDLYCVFEATDEVPVGASAFGLRDQCADTVIILTGNENNPSETEICVADSFDGIEGADLPNRANTALTRPRLSLQGDDEDGDGIYDSAWVIVAAEESKGLGNTFFEPDGLTGDFDGYADPCEEGSTLSCTEEIGKNQWYYSFDMGTPDTSAGIDDPDSLVSNLVSQGNMLNQGEVYWETGELVGWMSTEDMEDYEPYNFDILNTEIARRASLLVQSVDKAKSGLLAIASWKQGPMRQGGPADTMYRRFLGCSVIEEDPEGPVISKVDWVQYLADGKNIKIKGTVSELDEHKKTGFFIRDAANPEEYIFFEENTAPKDWENFLATNIAYPPCYIQASDEDPAVEGQSIGNWGMAFDLTEFWEDIGVDCECTLPPETPPDMSSVTQEEAPVDTWRSKLTAAFRMVLDVVIPMAHAADNPYAFDSMVCEEWLIEADTNPYYPGGVCADPAINLSGNVPDTCIDDADGSDTPCPTVNFENDSTYGIGDTNPILQGVVQGEGNTQRVLTWHQCPSDYALVGTPEGDAAAVDCDTDDRTDDFANLLDQSWYNPLDISKGHRGFIDGNFVMFLHAWSPNWRLNAKGNDRYDLYVRRSFDGGETWTTTPSDGLASDGVTPYGGDGTVTCENYRPTDNVSGDRNEPTACFEFAAGANEHMRNITQHRSMNTTTLDPRYAATKATIEEGCTDGLFVDNTVIDGIFTCDDLSEELDSDLRDPSRYFMVYETGDNTTVEVGEAEPEDLFYSRAESFGDDYVVWAETDTDTADPTLCYPNDPHDDAFITDPVIGSGFCNEFDNMNTGGDTHASEANMEANPDGSKLYSVWAQWVFEVEDPEEVADSTAQARRIWWIDDYISDTESWTLPGTQQP